MCGIAGWISGEGDKPRRDVIVGMTRALAHRGPDAEGVVIDGPVAFGHRRLSVIDLSAASNQPMWDSSGCYLLVYNGEIYNFKEIRRHLESVGHVFATHGDTEVLLEALKAWGPAALQRLNGMFAFALWDKTRRKLVIGRDRVGKKPLFVSRLRDGGVAFASEPRALREHPDITGDIDHVALARYLRLNYVPCNGSLFAGIESLPPACYGEFNLVHGLRITRYWNLAAKYQEKRSFASAEQAADALVALLDDAVRIRLVADVPLGVFLSSGVDSSSIVASMVTHRDPSTVHTFSSGFVEDSFDESGLAERFAHRVRAIHRTQTLDSRAIDLLPAIVAAAQEPLADSSVLPMYFLSKFTREHVTVALSGDGGDECFAGYETYSADKMHAVASIAPRSMRAMVPGLLDRFLPVDHRKVGWPEKLRRFGDALALDWQPAHASWRDIFGNDELLRLLRHDSLGAVDQNAGALFDHCFREHFAEVEGSHPVDQASYVDIKTWLAEDILVKADRMSMAHSLEVRCPLLDHRIVEFAAQLPPQWKLRGWSKKYILRLSQRNRLPKEVLERRKRGFNAPVSQWLLGPMRSLCRDTITSSLMTDWFERKEIDRLWNEHARKRRDHGLKLFGLLMVGLFLESNSATRPAVRLPLRSASR